MPLIGISTGMERARWTVWDRRAYLSPVSYADAVERAGGLPILIPPSQGTIDNATQILEHVDGLLLSGGADIDPAAYGQKPHPSVTHTSPQRDRAEIALAQAALDLELPLLGVCRGMQLLNVALGGTLIQHLPDDLGHGDHRRTLGSFENADHDVRIEPGTLAHQVVGEDLHCTKSHHHQGVDRLGEGLVASGWSTLDDLVEVIEMLGRWVLGVQWHPESDGSSPVVAGLVQAAAHQLV